ncbi:MAG: hypothetical protein AAF220_04670 [Pseudomonadota bacterium]
MAEPLNPIEERQSDNPVYWHSAIETLETKDWERRVRISADGERGGRIGPVALTPTLGIKFALRSAMIARAEAELDRISAEVKARRLEQKLMGRRWIGFATGGLTVGVLAALLRWATG